MKLGDIVPTSNPRDPKLLGKYVHKFNRDDIEQLIEEAKHNIGSENPEFHNHHRLELLENVREIQLYEEKQPRKDFYVFQKLIDLCWSGNNDAHDVFRRVGDILYLEPNLIGITYDSVLELINREGNNSDFSSPLINSNRFLNLSMRYFPKDGNGKILDTCSYRGGVDIRNIRNNSNMRRSNLRLIPNLCTL